MASTDARPVPRKNTAFRVTFPILDADGDPVVGAGGLDSEVSLDGAAFADCTNEATGIAEGMYYLDLTSTEMNADTVAIVIQTTTSGAKTTPIVIYPEEADDIRANITATGLTAVNGEVLDVLATDTFAEPSAIPAATATLEDKISFIYTYLRNKMTQTNTTKTLRNDADSANIGTAAVSDDGTTVTRGEWTSA